MERLSQALAEPRGTLPPLLSRGDITAEVPTAASRWPSQSSHHTHLIPPGMSGSLPRQKLLTTAPGVCTGRKRSLG